MLAQDRIALIDVWILAKFIETDETQSIIHHTKCIDSWSPDYLLYYSLFKQNQYRCKQDIFLRYDCLYLDAWLISEERDLTFSSRQQSSQTVADGNVCGLVKPPGLLVRFYFSLECKFLKAILYKSEERQSPLRNERAECRFWSSRSSIMTVLILLSVHDTRDILPQQHISKALAWFFVAHLPRTNYSQSHESHN